ncbi:site-specific integrase [Mycobacterium fragae]|uniref:Integrase n=1 Tax=Mycobacterium fragae TaxID=1260918 RepID=A0A1X1V365_9MYCO|nr:site-specific integrase [Mycobacterium fragae]MCV7399769.1 site-specific integrase [Mycobacterium fragae]ORV63467.1 integrase [Mycobacterium fragae]
MAGRPPLRIGAHGKITRTYLGGGVWMARCRYRDSDGVTRIVERRGPADEHDQHGKLAEDVLIEALMARRSCDGDEITLDTRIMALVDAHIDRLAEDGRSIRTIDTYRYCAKLLAKIIAGVRVGESTPARIDAAIRSMRRAHGDVMAVQSKTILKGGLHLAVMANVIGSNPVRDVSPIRSRPGPKGAPALTADELRGLLAKLRASDYCQRNDLVDPITLFIATGERISELLAQLWTDFDEQAGMVSVTGKLVRAAGKGLVRVNYEAKTPAGLRTIPLPRFAVETLCQRRSKPYLGEQTMIFPSTAGTWRDPDNFRARWRKVRDDLGVPDVTPHSFRKALATLIDDEGLSARIGADHLGHARVSETQDTYMARGRSHRVVADLLDRAISDE